MMKRLSIENYALIDKLDIDFAPGLNIITGETGAGKSILLGALGLVLGGRSDVTVLRDAGRNCVIEVEFLLAGYDLEPFFEANDIEYQEQSLIRRVITPAGKSRAYVNDLPVQLTTLRQIGERLIDIHSQHQTLLVGENRFQINLVDSVSAHAEVLEQYRTAFAELTRTERELAALKRRAEAGREELDYMTHQLQELRTAKLLAGEQEELEGLLKELTHANEIKETLIFTTQALDGDDTGILLKLKSLELSLGRLQEVYPRAEEFYQRMHSVLLELRDLAMEVATQEGRVEADPQRLEQTQRRLDTLYTLQQKHKVDSVEALIALQTSYEQRLSGIESSGEAIEALSARLAELHTTARRLAAQLTANRRKAAPRVENHVGDMLSELGMPAAQLRVEITPTEGLSEDGADQIRFLFTANRNSALQPIEKVASGGEMSRLMLALKALVAHHTQLPTLIFDEIDTGVSGLIADKMGEIIVRLASDLQIINITHLPQVASKGDHHFLVYKQESADRTSTLMRKLSEGERIEEIAKMLSGSDITSAALEQARLLLAKG